MATTSSLLVNEEAARHFCRKFLLPYKRPRIMQCIARKKYSDNSMKMGNIILERIFLRFDQGQQSEDAFIRELLKMSILADAGMYIEPSKPNEASKTTTIKQEWMVPYITVFCLDEDDAADGFVAKVIEVRKSQRKALEKQKEADKAPCMSNVMSKMTTLLHQHPYREHRWLKLDVDTKDLELIQKLQESLKGATVLFAAESRGGYHVVLEKGQFCQSLYKFERAVNKGVPKEDHWISIENNNGALLAIPGTNQGGFVVQCRTEMWKEGVK